MIPLKKKTDLYFEKLSTCIKFVIFDATHVGIRLQNLDVADVTASELDEVVI